MHPLADLCGMREKKNRKFGIRVALDQKVAHVKLSTFFYSDLCTSLFDWAQTKPPVLGLLAQTKPPVLDLL